jgi:allene oxide cyclase-like protein
MPRKLLTLVAAVLAAASVAVGVAVAGAHSQKADRQTLQFAIQFSDFFLLDLGEQGPSKGDQLVDNDRLLNASGKEVGHDGLACTFTDPAASEAACQGSFVLPGGQITVQFLNSPPSVKIGAITGGTGRFRGAGGQMKLVEPATGNVGSITFFIDD